MTTSRLPPVDHRACREIARQRDGLPFGRVDDRTADGTDVIEECRTGDTTVVDAQDLCAGIASEFFGVDVPRIPGGGVVVDEYDDVACPHRCGVLSGGDRVQPIRTEQSCAESMLGDIGFPHPAIARSRLPSATRAACACEGTTQRRRAVARPLKCARSDPWGAN